MEETHISIIISNKVLLLCCRIQKLPRLLVASQDSYLYIYNIDPNEGGDCMLLRQHR